LRAGYEGRGTRAAVPVHDGCVGEAGSVHRERERAACGHRARRRQRADDRHGRRHRGDGDGRTGRGARVAVVEKQPELVRPGSRRRDGPRPRRDAAPDVRVEGVARVRGADRRERQPVACPARPLAPPRRLVNVTVTPEPAGTDAALIVSTGGVPMRKPSAADVPPPGAGVNTVTWDVPATAMSSAVIAACNCVALTNVVVRAGRFHRTTETLVNDEPFTVSVNAGPPTVVLGGERDVRVGAGVSAGSTVTAGLVAARTYPLSGKYRNSY